MTLGVQFTCPRTIGIRWVFLVVRLVMNVCPLTLRATLVNSNVPKRLLLHCLLDGALCFRCDAILITR